MFRPCLDASRNNKIRNRRNLIAKSSITILLCVAHLTTVLPLELDDSGEENELFKRFQEDYSEDMEPFKKELNNCMEQTEATKAEADKFLRKVPQTTRQGKCYVACILTKRGIMRNDSIDVESYMRLNKEVYGEDNEITTKLKIAMEECLEADVDSDEVCERASFFSDCINLISKVILREAYWGKRGAAVGPTEDFPFETLDERFDDREEL